MDEWQSVEFVLLAVMRKADLALVLVAYNAVHFCNYWLSLPVLATPLRERTPQGGTPTVDQGRGNG